jgi:hypothetical protein
MLGVIGPIMLGVIGPIMLGVLIRKERRECHLTQTHGAGS